MKYAITIPGADAMVEAERKERLPAEWYASRTLVENVARNIERQAWLDAGGERNVSIAQAALNMISNVPGYQLAVLEELIERLHEGRRIGQFSMEWQGPHHFGSWISHDVQSLDIRLYRTDFSPILTYKQGA
jgi:hypothetical protein